MRRSWACTNDERSIGASRALVPSYLYLPHPCVVAPTPPWALAWEGLDRADQGAAYR